MSDVDLDIVEAIALRIMPSETKRRIRALSFGERIQLIERVRDALAQEASSRAPRTSG